MSSKTELNTEEKILFAAEVIFLRDGYDGARMQAIADQAGINKAMLHYYFRSKEILFEKIFDKKILKFFPDISSALENESLSFEEKIGVFVEKYIQLLSKYPYLPLFVMTTINKTDKKDFINKLPLHIFENVTKAYFESLAKGEVKEMNVMQFMLSVMGMCAFPFLAKPIVQSKFSLSHADFNALMEDRISELKKYVHAILEP